MLSERLTSGAPLESVMAEAGGSTSTGRGRKRASTAYGIKIAPKRTLAKRRKDGTWQPGWETVLNAVGLRFLVYLIRATFAGICRLFNSVFLLSLPLAVLLFLTSTDFLVLTAVNDSFNQLFFDEIGLTFEHERRYEVEVLKTQVLEFVYWYVLIFSLFHWRAVYGYLKAWPHWSLLVICLATGALHSIEPIKVGTNTALIIVSLCTAVLFSRANAESRHHDAFYKSVFIPMLVLHVASIGIFFLYDTPLIEFLLSSGRYGGLAGNPNTLGATIVLGYWAAISLVLSSSASFFFRLAAIAAIPLFLLHVVMSGSGTALVGVIVVTTVVFWLRILAFFKPTTRHVLNGAGAVILIMVLLGTLVSTTPTELYLAFTTSLGKDQTLTGRTELWDVARDAISQRPYFGWSFDSHASVMSIGAFDIDFNHYHNGYLDTLVAGGFVLLALIMYNVSRFSRAFFLAFRKDSTVFPFILPLVILLFLNFSEYSLLRPNSPIWQIYVIAFVMLTYQQKDRLLSRFMRKGKPVATRSRKRQLRWA
jgi:O-antigen ligase